MHDPVPGVPRGTRNAADLARVLALTTAASPRDNSVAATLRWETEVTAEFGRETWSLVVPEGWRAWHDSECATLVGPGSFGALQISAAFKGSEVLDADLRDFASEHLDAGAMPSAIQAGDFVGFEISLRDGDRFWRRWYLRHATQVLFVTYNCDLESRGTEDGAIREALSTLAAKERDLGRRGEP